MAQAPEDRPSLPREFGLDDVDGTDDGAPRPGSTPPPDAPPPTDGPDAGSQRGERSGTRRRRPPADDPPARPAPGAAGAAAATPRAFRLPDMPTTVSLVTDSVITRPLAERMAEAAGDERIGIVIEVRSDGGIATSEALEQLRLLILTIAPNATAWETRSYVMAALTSGEILELVERDAEGGRAAGAGLGTGPSRDQRTAPRRFISRIWPNFEVRATIHRSVMTVKADAAVRAFEATGAGIVWAVLDTGVEAKHPHFATHRTLELPQRLAHKSFVAGSPDPLVDANGHGTHVAGIIAGGQVATTRKPIVAATWYRTASGEAGVERVQLPRISGMAPEAKILSCTVLRPDRTGDVAALLEALEYIQDLNHGGRELNVHGVNLSLGYPFDPSWFATGLSPVCREVDRLVADGVCVVVSAGNTGYGAAQDSAGRAMALGFGMTINDPGNSARAITVGSTSINPYTTGVSYFSSKGPTGDGRMKPDLVAPGERVVSAGAGEVLAKAREQVEDATYVEDSGTSMSAPHVSGVAASFLSVHREFVGRPDDVKRILMDSASDLGRDPTFQGRGLVDAMRAIQSV
jgi:serine protease AprX